MRLTLKPESQESMKNGLGNIEGRVEKSSNLDRAISRGQTVNSSEWLKCWGQGAEVAEDVTGAIGGDWVYVGLEDQDRLKDVEINVKRNRKQ